MNIKFKLKDVDVEEFNKTSKEKMRNVLFKSVVKMTNLAKQNAPVDTGELRRRINFSPRIPNQDKYIVASGVDYGYFVEYGTMPHYVHYSLLKSWSRRVLGDPTAAIHVARKIRSKGTPAQPFFRPALMTVKEIWLPKFASEEFE